MTIRFILNPISGKKNDTDFFIRRIRAHFEQAQICLTQAPGHATQLAQEAVAQGAEAVIAIGGDGTLNETARGLVGSQTALGVVPKGSGNGFAREIGPMRSLDRTLKALKYARPLLCDVGRANGELFLNLAGVGIEADIAWKFKDYGKRGMLPYFKIGAQTVFSYQPKELHVTFDNHHAIFSPLTLVFANGKQYGSNFKIAPQASLQDGLLDMVVVQNAPKWKLALATPYFFTNRPRPFHITTTYTTKHAVVSYEGEILYHIDGEPRKTKDRLEISTQPKALRVLIANYEA